MDNFSIFFDDYKVYHEGESFAIFRLYPAGEINLKSGEIIASDPFNSDTKPLKKKVKPGKYPITIAVKHYDVAADVVAAYVQFNDENPVKWESALGYTSKEEPYGIPIDSAIGCFIDYQDYQKFQKKLSEEGWNDNFYNFIQKKIEDSMKENYFLFANIAIEDIGINFIAFPTGFGDGAYPCYWGYDENDEVACLLIDFLIVKFKKYSSCPPIPEYSEPYFDWLVRVQEKNDDILINKKPLDKEILDFLKSTITTNIPDAILKYYKYCTPWHDLENPKDLWKKILKHIKEKHNFEALPIFVSNNESYTVAKIIAPNKFRIWDMYKDGFYLCANDLWTFFINAIITRYD